jgi:Lar family restriction alleviation protein
MENRELKPCPFCGDEAHLDRHDIFCDCGAKIEIPQYVGGKVSIAGFPTYEEAVQQMIDAWNRRADDGKSR